MSSPIDRIIAESKRKEEEEKRQFQQQQQRFQRIVEERQRKIGQGEFGKGGKKDVRAEAKAEAEARVAAERSLFEEKNRAAGPISAGKRRSDDSSRQTSATGKAPVITEDEITQRQNEIIVERAMEEQKRIGSSQGTFGRLAQKISAGQWLPGQRAPSSYNSQGGPNFMREVSQTRNVIQGQTITGGPQELTPAQWEAARRTAEKVNRIIDQVNAGQIPTEHITDRDVRMLEMAGVSDIRQIKDQVDFAAGRGGNADFGILAPSRPGPIGALNAISFEAMDERGNVTQRAVVPHVQLPTASLPEAPAPSGNVIADFFAGLVAPFENIGGGIAAAATGKSDEFRPKADIEADLIGAGITAGSQFFSGQRVDVTPELSQIQQNIMENPAYAAGNIAASVITFFGPGLAVKAAKGTLITAGKASELAVKATQTAAKATGRTPEEIIVRPVKVQRTARGTELIELRQSPIPGTAIEPVQVNLGTKGAPVQRTVEKVTRPDAYEIREASTGEVLGYVSGKGTKLIPREQLSQAQKETLTGQKIVTKHAHDQELGTDVLFPSVKNVPTTEVAAESVIDVFQREAEVLPKVFSRTEAEALGDIGKHYVIGSEGVKVAESRPIGQSIISFSRESLEAGIKAEERERKLQEKAAAKLGDLVAKPATPSSRPFEFSTKTPTRIKPSATSKTPLENIAIFKTDRELGAAQKAAIDLVIDEKAADNVATAIGLGGGASLFTAKGTLGLGGATGAGQRRGTVEEDVVIYLTQPPGMEGPKPKTESIAIEIPVFETGLRSGGMNEPSDKPQKSTGTMDTPGQQVDLTPIIDLDLTPKLTRTSRTTTGITLTPKQDIIQIGGFKLDNIRITPTRIPPPTGAPFDFPKGGGGILSFGGRGGLTNIKKFGVKNLIFPELSLTEEGTFVGTKKGKKKKKKGLFDLELDL